MRPFPGLVRRRRLAAVGVIAVALAACSSAPTHYYTLMPPAAPVEGAAGPAALTIDVLPVGVPAQVDQPQLVVRVGDGSVAVLDGERWVAPLADEIRAALSDDLVRELGARDARGQAAGDRAPTYRIAFDVRRFESVPSDHALIESDWSVRRDGEDIASCSGSARVAVGAGYEALVEGQQQALARIAAQIAAVVRRAEAGASAPGCSG